MNRINRATFAKLTVMLAINKARFMANPEPVYNKIQEQLHGVRKVLEDIQYALSPIAVVDWQEEHRPMMKPLDIQGEALIRCNAAKDILDSYLKGGGR